MRTSLGKIILLFPCFLAAALVAGCLSSSPEYKQADFTGEKLYNKNATAGSELNENEVLGLSSGSTTDLDIAKVLETTRDFHLRDGSTVLLVQSGSDFPDAAMQKELSRYFRVRPHSGLAADIRQAQDISLANALRMAAARSSAETIVVYWGHLELKRKDLGTDIVSWLPVLDLTVPDEYQKYRLRLRLAVMDVLTGKWSTFQVEPFETDALSTRFSREHNQPATLNTLKKKAYAAAVRQLREDHTH